MGLLLMALGGCGRFGFGVAPETDGGTDAIVPSGDAAIVDGATDGFTERSDAAPSDASEAEDGSEVEDGTFDMTTTDASIDAGPPDATADMDDSVALTLLLTGDGTGDVAIDGVPRACGRSCTSRYPRGTTLSLAARPDAEAWFRGWAVGPCSGRAMCSVTLDEDVTIEADFTPRPNRIFVTSEAYDGNLGGLAGADAICQGHADAASLTGTWRALISTSTTSWLDRLAGLRGWVRVDGQPVLDFPLSTARMLGVVSLDELGATQYHEPIWMLHSGATEACDDYTSAASDRQGLGEHTWRAASWNAGGEAVPCNELRRLLCAEADIYQAVSPIQARGRGAFTTTGTWSVSTGRPTADALCATEASSAGRTGTYLALLAHAGERPLDRFDLDGPPWVRHDGLAFLPTARDWETAVYFDVAPSLTATGAAQGFSFAFEGARGPAGVGPVNNCNNWTFGSGTSLSSFCGYTWRASANCGEEASGVACTANVRVFCLEE